MSAPKVLAFDVFGTVVDWHGSISREAESLIPGIDGDTFASAWRAGYKPAMADVRSGKLGWTKIDDLHRLILDRILVDFGIDLSEEKRRHLNRAWHRLDAWPDTVAGMTRLKSRFMLTTLSNGNLGLLANMAKNAGLPWDLLLSAEVFRHYKPDPETYLGVAEIFDIQPSEVMLVAAHEDDLDAAKACGLQTAFVERPLEYGLGKAAAKGDLTRFTYASTDLNDLARQMGV
ncbi:MAG: haloacid dehalogenase type II [Oxalobacteraceae bacterium]|jgi:2-haloacid dehalogenase|nr:haloacid dehalogenase type II [Oxalobacteraceae bacterium]